MARVDPHLARDGEYRLLDLPHDRQVDRVSALGNRQHQADVDRSLDQLHGAISAEDAKIDKILFSLTGERNGR